MNAVVIPGLMPAVNVVLCDEIACANPIEQGGSSEAARNFTVLQWTVQYSRVSFARVASQLELALVSPECSDSTRLFQKTAT